MGLPQPHLVLELECERPLAGPARYRLSGIGRVRLGRGAARSADTDGEGSLALRIADGWMSSGHAELRLSGGRWEVADLDSKNGSFLNGVRFSVEPVPPAKAVEFANPDGDGEFKLIVKNESDREVEIPALLADAAGIRWNESIVIRCRNKTYPIPGSTGNIAGLKSVVLKPGESVVGATHVFALVGPEWPMGGDRVEFQFCLAEKSATHSFYYLSRHHDPIRAAIRGGATKH